MSDWEKQIFDTMVEWTVYGVPDTADYLQPATGSHNLSYEELQLSLDKLGKCVVIFEYFSEYFPLSVTARFIDSGFIFGPLNPSDWPYEAPHSISTFVRYQKVRKTSFINCFYHTHKVE